MLFLCSSRRLFLLPVLLGIALLTLPAAAQPAGSETASQSVQAGVGALTGIGLQAGYILPRSFYTLEGALYVNTSPPFAGGEGDLLTSGGVGGALRLVGALTTLNIREYSGYHLDVGFRFGPALHFQLLGTETIEEKNKRFELFLEPFVRFLRTLGGGRTVFAEAGTRRPFLRAGLWWDF